MRCQHERHAERNARAAFLLGILALLSSVLGLVEGHRRREAEQRAREGWRERARQHAGPISSRVQHCGDAVVLEELRCLGCGWSERVESR